MEDVAYICDEYAIVGDCHAHLYDKFLDMKAAFGKFDIKNGFFDHYKAGTHSLFSDEVKGVAASSSWLGIIWAKANKVYKFKEKKIETYEEDGIAFDEHLILCLVLPIHYANLKSSDLINVSKGV